MRDRHSSGTAPGRDLVPSGFTEGAGEVEGSHNRNEIRINLIKLDFLVQ